MPKTYQININNFSSGISDAPRVQNPSQFQIAKMFDAFQDPNRLIPYRSLETDDTDVKTYFVRDFLYASASSKLYGLGQTGAGLTKIVYKADAISGAWTLPSSSDGNGAVKNGCLLEYKDYLWGFQGTNQVFKWGTLSGTPSITNSVSTVGATITSVANGVIAKDDNGYIAYNNIIVRINPGGTIQDAVLTLPSNYKVTSLTNYQNYLAIGCSPIASYNGQSKVFLWKLTSSDVTEAIDWGEGDLRVLETVEGYLVGITDRYLNNTTGAGKGSMIIQIWGGGAPQVVKEIFTQALVGKTIPTSKALRNNRVFWSAKIMTDSAGTTYNEGLWSFGRKSAGYGWSINLDVVDDTITTSGIQGFGIAGNYFFVACNNDGTILKTNDSAVYTTTSVYESQIINFGEPFVDKRLEDVSLACVPLTSGQTLTLKMKTDSDTSWTTIGTMNTVGQAADTFFNIISTDANFPSGKEYSFRIESTGGAQPTTLGLRASSLIE